MKIPMSLHTVAAVTALAAMSFQSLNAAPSEVADSVSVLPYASADGKSGLRLAYSTDNGSTWQPVAGGYDLVKCDFGSWGNMKTIFSPYIVPKAGGGWEAVWFVTAKNETYAVAETDDLVNWLPQKYFKAAEFKAKNPGIATSGNETTATIDGKVVRGRILKMPSAVIENIESHAREAGKRHALNTERMADDSVRFAGLKPLKGRLEINGNERKEISDKLIGIFFEDINYAADGGLYAEMVQNRDFEYRRSDSKSNDWHSGYAWSLTDGEGKKEVPVSDTDPIHPNNPHYASISTASSPVSLTNTGYDGMAVRKGEKYLLSLLSRLPEAGVPAVVKVILEGAKGNELASSTVTLSGKGWNKAGTELTAAETDGMARLRLEFTPGTRVDLDMISLFPAATFHGRRNGLRNDLATALADMKPRFVRFPGGCVAHGNGVDNIYDWKGSVGPLESRKPLRNIWGYHQTRGLGYHEYFEFCEDLGAEPVPVLAAGVPCQNSAIKAHHSVDELTSYGQQGGIPMDEMGEYVQDVLDLIEYANGDSRLTRWGAVRAANGHPEPFNLKYIGIGNEDMITDVFEERFRMIYDAVRAKYPEITVIGTVGPFYEGSDYDRGWQLAQELDIPMVDEHYYVDPGWMIHNQDFYDRYRRNGTKVYLGEYAAHLPGRPSNVETSLAEALYLLSVERNADVVAMTSYAPLLAKDGHTQWRPDLIYFNNREVKPTVDYHVQKLFGNNSGNEYVSSALTLDDAAEDARLRVGASVVRDSDSGDYIVKLANLLPVEVSLSTDLSTLGIKGGKAAVTELKGDPADRKALPRSSETTVDNPSDVILTMAPYSFKVIRITE